MADESVQQFLANEWWWIHILLLGVTLGGSLGMWAYRDCWYGISTFLAGPIESTTAWRLLRQWAASLMLLSRAVITVVLIATVPLVYWQVRGTQTLPFVIGGAIGIWLLLRLLLTYRDIKQPKAPSVFGRPWRWAYYRAAQAPDLPTLQWIDFLLGLGLHAGLAFGWYELSATGRTSAWWQTLGGIVTVAAVLVATSISVYFHPPAVSHEGEPRS